MYRCWVPSRDSVAQHITGRRFQDAARSYASLIWDSSDPWTTLTVRVERDGVAHDFEIIVRPEPYFEIASTTPVTP